MAAPAMDATPADVDRHLRQIITNLYVLLVQAHDYQGSSTQEAMSTEIKQLLQNLQELTRTSRRLPTTVPIDLIQYVEEKRNPDVYKRQIVELVMQYNQLQKGRAQAFADFRDILGREMMSAIPDMKDDAEAFTQFPPMPQVICVRISILLEHFGAFGFRSQPVWHLLGILEILYVSSDTLHIRVHNVQPVLEMFDSCCGNVHAISVLYESLDFCHECVHETLKPLGIVDSSLDLVEGLEIAPLPRHFILQHGLVAGMF
ncbi:hypothetical protein Q7P37_004030 [Cladosporium fusiforme]